MDQDPRERTLTVAGVRAAAGEVEVRFFESARIYRVLRASPAYEATVQALRAAAPTGAPVRIRLVTPHGDVIESAVPAR